VNSAALNTAAGAIDPKDAAGNALSLTLPSGTNSLEGSKAIVINGTGPGAVLLFSVDQGSDPSHQDAGLIFDGGAALPDSNATLTPWQIVSLSASGSPISSGITATNGYLGLSQCDANLDSTIDAQDPVFNELRLWHDANQDGMTDSDELMTLAQAGLASLQLTPQSGTLDPNGNVRSLVTSWTDTHGLVHQMSGVWLQFETIQKSGTGQAGV
jgi:hypothetical protein